MSFLEKLDLLMKVRNINKAILSRESGIPYTTIDGFYKKGSDNIKLSTLKALSLYFGCSLDYLVDDNIAINNIVATRRDHEETWTPDELQRIEEYKQLLLAARKNRN